MKWIILVILIIAYGASALGMAVDTGPSAGSGQAAANASRSMNEQPARRAGLVLRPGERPNKSEVKSNEPKVSIQPTPDNAYAFQTGIGGNTLTIDIFPKSGTTEWHYQADISALQPLNPFASVVLKGDALGTGPASPGVYLNGTRLTVTRTSSAPSAVLDSMQMLRHLRLYRRQLSDHSISADAAAVFFAANDPGYAGWFRFNVPTAGSITTVNDTSTREQQYYDIYPAHGLLTTYIYNATNQVTMQRSPDGGVNRYWYDLLSRLSVSQNDKQKTANYSYTLYDTLGRVTEVGQKNQTTVSLGTPGYLSAATLNSFIAAGTNSQITHTYYDKPVDTVAGNTNGIASIHTQNNLRKRVAASTYADVQAGPVLRATYYTYDIDGNVNTLWQQLDGLYTPSTNAGLKRIDYEYDLVSGKVNFVRYQTSQPDAFYYAYSYDADNRITAAVASNRVVMDTVTGSMLPPSIRKLDARYYYYLHGPLRRMELGNDGAAVQGLDYAYTLQGWLKGVNSASGLSFQDMGLDSLTVAKDALGYSLGYYTGDYTPIGGTTYKAFTLQYSQTMGDITGQSLYNGNISNTTYAINQLGTPVGYTYAYDQLNRIKRMRQYAGIHGTSWSRANITQNYQENVTYDGSGNILTYGRNGVSPTTAQTIDSLSYHYTLANGKITTNKLNYITDAVSSSGYNLDLRNQTSITNYRYDALGNLIYDAYSGITGNGGVNSITWSVYNKPLKIYKAGADSITYTYNTANQRVSKNELGVTTWYVRDAQGNLMGLYDNIHGSSNWREQHLYGSSRLGMWMPNMNMVTNNSVAIWDTVERKQYELNNHLGNVMTTVTDKRLQHSTTGTSIDYFMADVANAQDYYPFGMLQPGRQYTFSGDSTYWYGFNGKENDNTVKGLGNQQDYGERFYDVRSGRFLSVDPLKKNYPWSSTYSFAENDVIRSIDLNGFEKYILYQRSFAPWQYFGQIGLSSYKYSGDNRGFTVSTSKDVSSKVSTEIQVDIGKATAKLLDASQHGNTTRYDAGTGQAMQTAPTVMPEVMLWRPQKNGIETSVVTRLVGKAPFAPYKWLDFASKALDQPIVWTGYTTVSNHISEGYILVKYTLTGKGFPAFESFIEDSKGVKIFIGLNVSPPKSEILDRLSGTELYSSRTFITKIYTDKSGNFLGVGVRINGQEVKVSPDEYNKPAEKNYPAAQDIPQKK